MKNHDLSAVQYLKSKTVQNFGISRFAVQDIDVNYSLAYNIYLFLEERKDTLPGFETLDFLINSKKSGNNIISLACGVEVIYNANGSLMISIVEPISATVERIDYISADEYSAIIVGEDKDGKMTVNRKVDLIEMPRYKKERVDVLMKYLLDYRNLLENKKVTR